MLILHTSDWHIGQTFYHFDREDEHNHIFMQMAEIMRACSPDALVVSGDIFHNATPSASAQRLIVDTVIRLHEASPETVIVITAGNHDSGSRLASHSALWEKIGVRVIGAAVRDEKGCADPKSFFVDLPECGRIVAVPFFHPSNYPLMRPDADRTCRCAEFFSGVMREALRCKAPIVLMAHLAVDGCDTKGHEYEPVGGQEKEPVGNMSEGYDYLALGHIHCPQQISDRAFYCGSPLPVNFTENYQHSVNLVNLTEQGAIPEVKTLPLSPLREMITIEASSFDNAIERLIMLDDKDDNYYRLLIDSEEPLPADADSLAMSAVKGKRCRYCETRKVPREKLCNDENNIRIDDICDMAEYSPLDIARQSWRRVHGEEMSEELATLLSTAIFDLNQEHDA